jgi:Fur family transcriptional regulator, ferric uptake regulator
LLIANVLQLENRHAIVQSSMNPPQNRHLKPYKKTKPRLAVLSFLQKHSQPKTIKEISRGLKTSNINLASIYRTLELFKHHKIVNNENILGERRYYLALKHHHHIVCRKCHAIECIPCQIKIEKPTNYKDIVHELNLTGICHKCSV